MPPFKHLFISGKVQVEQYKSSGSGGGRQKESPERDRAAHSQKLLTQFAASFQSDEALKKRRASQSIPSREGTYLSFIGAAGYELITKSLDQKSKGIHLLNVQEKTVGENIQTSGTVYVPKGMEGFFISKVDKYAKEDSKYKKPKNKDLVESIEAVQTALLESLWTDDTQLLPKDNEAKWCEIWLQVEVEDTEAEKTISAFEETLQNLDMLCKRSKISFPERAVLLVNATRPQLIELIHRSDTLAEFRAGEELAGFWANESQIEQQEWVDELVERLQIEENSNVRVCILDSGVNNRHPLIYPVLEDVNTLTINPTWGTDDHEKGAGHGTLMAGVSAFGHMESALASSGTIQMCHKLVSVKILPRPTNSPSEPELWGDLTSQAVARAEQQNPKDKLIFCMAVTSPTHTEKGRPSSWSGALDNLAFGEGENQRLLIVSAGNVREPEDWKNYPSSNYVNSIENPAQAWNVISVGAYTNKITIKDSKYTSFTPVACAGELSPHSRTSLMWEKKWPLKPEVVFEGGNLMNDGTGFLTSHEDVEVLTTSKSFRTRPFDVLNGTSAATAYAAWVAARIAFIYPDAWPESIRGLIVHSASWNEAMISQASTNLKKKTEIGNLMKVFGFGLPDLEKALYSRESAFTLIAQEVIQPFGYKTKREPIANEIHFYELPWPDELLLSLGEVPVQLKITLSYFIEPGEGRIGWKDKYRYQSHGLRFDVNSVGEDHTAFRKRMNILARDKNEVINSKSDSNRWLIGSDNRSSGSVSSDTWEGTAAELSSCNSIAVLPVVGWWKQRKHLKKVETKTRYSLIVSLATPDESIQLYTTVKNKIELPIEITIEPASPSSK